MRKWKLWAIWAGSVAVVSAVFTSKLVADSPLNGDKLITSLRPQHPVDRDFLTYTGALLEAGYLPRSLVESTFLWARDKPRYQARYFREGLIRRAKDQGIDLPTGQPPLQGEVEGQVIYLVFGKFPIPVSNAKVRLADRQTTADAWGRFSFSEVPFGQYNIRAEGLVGFVFRKGTGQVQLPTRPPSTDPATITIYVQ